MGCDGNLFRHGMLPRHLLSSTIAETGELFVVGKRFEMACLNPSIRIRTKEK